MRLLISISLVLLAAATQARAQPVFSYRCSLDSLDPAQAEARLAWARRCGLVVNVGSAGAGFDTGVPSSNGAGGLVDYAEGDMGTNPSGHNLFTGRVFNYEANLGFVSSLYNNGPTSQHLDGDGFFRWERTVDRKKPRPLYPTFGTEQDINSSTNMPLYPNPYDSYDCGLYTAAQLGNLAYGMLLPEQPCAIEGEPSVKCWEPPPPRPAVNFYINAYCESSCYTPEQQVLFPEGEASILDAVRGLHARVMALDPRSLLGDLELRAAEVHSYTQELRDASHPVVALRMRSGGSLRVTLEHPVLLDDGRIVQAQTVKPGAALLRADGKADEVLEAVRQTYFGKVYNLRPTTLDRVGNVLVAQGYLVGSSLFQNDEVGYMNRQLLFKSVPQELIP